MKEITGNIFAVKSADAICVTTNRQVKSGGLAVMGAGLAKAFALKYPTLQAFLGEDLRYRNGRVFALRVPGESRVIINLPTKNHWRDPSSILLVQESIISLVRLVDFLVLDRVILTQPGCGHGGLKWETVKKIIEPYLDDRFYIISPNCNPCILDTNSVSSTGYACRVCGNEMLP